MTNEEAEEVDQLKNEIVIGNKAKKAYDTYLEDYFAKARLNIFQRFCLADTQDEPCLVSIKHEQMALDNLEQATLTRIETGKMASKMLEDQ